jgi:hypothetical protein
MSALVIIGDIPALALVFLGILGLVVRMWRLGRDDDADSRLSAGGG